ncbi:MAG: hypothetical protein C0490_20165, partial [Marivirga sp.]|nr:hypothetical protein [Marivirga sp.]
MDNRGLHIVWFMILATACGKQTQEDHISHSEHDNKDAINLISRPVNQVVLSSQKTIQPLRGSNKNTLKANGYIAFDERRNNKVAVRIPGRIERLYVKYNYQYVKKGQPIAELYSPELSTYQEEYLFLMNSAEDSLAEMAKQKLKLLGLSESQILKVKNSGTVTQTVTITSSADGFIRFSSDPVSSAAMNSSTSAMSSMTGVSSKDNNTETTQATQIREGVYVNKGQTLFVVNDCRKVWVILSTDLVSQAKIKNGDSVTLSSELQKDPITAKVNFVEPIYQEEQRFTQLRIYLDNPLRSFKINSLIKAEFLSSTSGLTVPTSSVFDLGTRKIVWVK